MRVGEICVGRSGDKGATLDLTLVALDDASYSWLAERLDEAEAAKALGEVMPGTVRRYLVPGLRALKFVVDGALPGGVYAALHAGLHWQKAATWILLDWDLDGAPDGYDSP